MASAGSVENQQLNGAAELLDLAWEIPQRLQGFLQGCDLQPRDYQRRIIETAIRRFAGVPRSAASSGESSGEFIPQRDVELERGAASVLIESPTGSGKTVMGLAIAALLQQVTGARVGWVAMRRNLLTQAVAENHRRGLGVELVPISMFTKEPPAVDLLIVDEAQHDAATSMANLHSTIRPRWTLGLSATPYRSDRVKLCFDHVIRDAGIAVLIEQGFLSQYHHFTVPDHSPQFIAGLLRDEPDRWGKSLVFFHRREQCEELAGLLGAAGVSAEIVTATSNRNRQLEDFATGRTAVLINMAILTEGFDCPDLKTVFCRPSGKGCTIQMAGRVLRKAPDIEHKQIVQCRHTKHPMLRTAMPAEQYLWTENGWRSIHANRRLDELTMIARRRVASAQAELPAMVAMHRNRQRSAWYSRG
ncbi:DEAD/DEAH box helicase [Planctomycetaceae bacterium SH139]